MPARHGGVLRVFSKARNTPRKKIRKTYLFFEAKNAVFDWMSQRALRAVNQIAQHPQ
jgi:hypothetical protein